MRCIFAFVNVLCGFLGRPGRLAIFSLMGRLHQQLG